MAIAIYGEATVTVYGIAIYYIVIDTHELRAYREEFDTTYVHGLNEYGRYRDSYFSYIQPPSVEWH